MRVGPVHACLCACDVRGGRTGPETTTIHPHRTWTAKSAHKRPHTPSTLNGAPHARESRSEQGVETDGGVTGEYA